MKERMKQRESLHMIIDCRWGKPLKPTSERLRCFADTVQGFCFEGTIQHLPGNDRQHFGLSLQVVKARFTEEVLNWLA